MMEMVDMLGLGSSSFKKSKGSTPFFGKYFILMWFVAGKILNIVVQLLVISLFKIGNLKNLTVSEKILGWFLIEHIFVEYNYNSGKFFFINKDFRKLITNITRLIRNLTFWAHIITMLELITFSLIIIFVMYLLSVHFYYYFLNKYSYKDVLCLFFWFFFFKKIFHRYSKFDLFFVSRPLAFLFEFICIYFYFFLIFFIGYCYIRNYKTKQIKYLNLKLLLIKFFIILIFVIILGFFIYDIFLIENENSNNFIQELVVRFLFIYTYLYYILL